jgi:hypothetical protein
MNRSEQIEIAFLQLSFALKLWHYVEEGHLSKEKFDISITFEDGSSIVPLVHNEFDNYSELINASYNNVLIAFGNAAITLSNCIQEKYEQGKYQYPQILKTEEEKIFGLIYMIRCAYAHNMCIPQWKNMKIKYKIKYQIYGLNIDLSSRKEGESFDMSHISGFDTLYVLRDGARHLNMF